MNRTNDEQEIPRRMQGALLAALRVSPKSLWLCASEAGARRAQAAVERWLPENGMAGHPSWLLTSLGNEIDQFRSSPTGHLFVAGRFDGMDFRGAECRIVVGLTLPRAINLQEEFITTYLRDSGFMRRRLNQRIVQALGRCNRSAEDYAVYFLADRRFATHFARESSRVGISPNVAAEIDVAQDLAESPEAAVVGYVTRFFAGDFLDYNRDLERALRDAPTPAQTDAPPRDTSADEVVGWAAMDSKNYGLAAERFEACWSTALEDKRVEIGALHGWHHAKALYLAGRLGDLAARARALQVLDSAIRRGGQSSWFNRMRASLLRTQAASAAASAIESTEYGEVLVRSFDDLLEKVGTRGNQYQRYVGALESQLSSESHDEFMAGMQSLGALLGYTASRPKYGAATDCRWRGVFGNVREVVTFEGKIEQSASGKVTASDLGQAHNQHQRAVAEFGDQGYTVRGTVITPLQELHEDASSSIGPLKVLSKEAAQTLWRHVQLLLSTYRSGWSLDSVSTRASAAVELRAKLPVSGWLTQALSGPGPFVPADILLAAWRGD